MDLGYIKYEHFTSKERYCHLQSHFAAHDVSYPIYEVREEPMENFKILDYEFNELEIEKQVQVDFLDDYIFPALNQIHNRYFREFQRQVVQRNLFTEEKLKSFGKYYLNFLNKANDKIEMSDYLPMEVRSELTISILELIDLIEEYLKNPFPYLQTKIKFNWSRTDVIYFFHLLQLNGSIEPIRHADLGRIIDSSIEYLDSKDGNHKEIRSSRKHLSDFGKTSRSEIEANGRLKTLFQNDDFFNH